MATASTSPPTTAPGRSFWAGGCCRGPGWGRRPAPTAWPPPRWWSRQPPGSPCTWSASSRACPTWRPRRSPSACASSSPARCSASPAIRLAPRRPASASPGTPAWPCSTSACRRSTSPASAPSWNGWWPTTATGRCRWWSRPATTAQAVALRAGKVGEAVATAPAPGAAVVRNGDHARNRKGARAPDQGMRESSGAGDRTAPRAGGSAAVGDGSAAADDEPAGDEFDMATIADLENALRKVLNEGTGQGQSSWAATSASSYQATRTVHERLGEATTVARATREAVDAAQLALTERTGQLADVAQATKEAVDGLDLDLSEKQVQAIADASISRVGDEVADRVAGRLGPTVISALRDQFSRE